MVSDTSVWLAHHNTLHPGGLRKVVPRKAVSHWAQHGKMLQVPSGDVSPPLPPALFSRGISQPQPHLRKVSALPELAPGHLVSPLGRW